jgi:hypothetical protein
MSPVFDEDIQRVMEYMQGSIAADRLVSVSVAIANLAPSLWGHYGSTPVVPLSFQPDPIVPHDLRIQSSSSERHLE